MSVDSRLYISNNPLVKEKRGISLFCVDGGFMDVLTCARDFVHKGHKLLTHPLSGSVKPGETPYKTLALSGEPGFGEFGRLCLDSLRIIEEAIITARKLTHEDRIYSEEKLKDFQLIDYTLIFS